MYTSSLRSVVEVRYRRDLRSLVVLAEQLRDDPAPHSPVDNFPDAVPCRRTL